MKEGAAYRFFRVARVPLILLFIALTALSLAELGRLRTDFGFHSLFEKSAGLDRLIAYKQTYGEDVNLLIVSARAPGGVFTPGALARIDALTRFLEARPEIHRVTSLTKVDVIRSREDELAVEPFMASVPQEGAALAALREEALASRQLRRYLVSDDATVSAVIGEFKGHLENRDAIIEATEQWIARDAAAARPGGAKVALFLGGLNVIQRAYEKASSQDIVRNGVAIFLVMGVILFLQYRSVAGVVLPLLASLVSLALVLGLMAVTGEPINMVSQVVPELILILGVADGVYLLSRYVEERRRHPPAAAFDRTMRAMAVACFFTSITTVAGFGSCVVAQMYIIRRFGVYTAAGVTISFLCVMLFIASIVSFGRGRSAGAPTPAAPAPPPPQEKPDLTERFLSWVARVVTGRPLAVVAVSVALAAVSVAFATRLRMQHKLLTELRDDHPVVRANDVFEQSLFGILSYGIELEGPPDSMIEPDVLKKIDRVVAAVEKDPGVRKTSSLSATLREFNMKWMGEGERYDTVPASRRLAAQYLEFLDPEIKKKIVNDDYSKTRVLVMTRNLPSSWWYGMTGRLAPLLDGLFPPGGEVRWRFNGSSHFAAVSLHHLMTDMFATMLSSLLAITLLMALLFRSLRIGLVSIVPNALPLVTTAGFMGATGIELRPATSIIFAVTLGIAVNDTIHLFARFREEVRAGADPRRAVTTTIMTAGRPIVYTSVLLVTGYLVLVPSPFTAVRDFAILFAVTLLGALLTDLFVASILLLHVVERKKKR